MIGQAYICPSKCHEAKPLHIPLESIGTKYDGIHSCPLRVIDFGTKICAWFVANKAHHFTKV